MSRNLFLAVILFIIGSALVILGQLEPGWQASERAVILQNDIQVHAENRVGNRNPAEDYARESSNQGSSHRISHNQGNLISLFQYSSQFKALFQSSGNQNTGSQDSQDHQEAQENQDENGVRANGSEREDRVQTGAGSVSVMSVSGTIGPTTTNYLERSKRLAEERGDEVLVMILDTPGGLLDSTQDIVQIMLGSDLPIVVYVAPEGANAGSAGTFMTLAGHIAAMAPATNIGAASPVAMGGGEMDTVAQRKIFEYSESYIESIAEQRDRNTEWAKSAVRDGAAITSREALELNVVDLIAEDLQDLLEQIDGMEIEGKVLNTAGAEIHRIDRNLAEIFFSFILRPEIMLILTLVAIYGIVGELTSPGAIVPGMSGVIALVLLLYGVAALPINIAGFMLIGLALALFVIEAFTPTYGVLLMGGAVSFFLGALMLFQDMPEGMQLSLYWLIPATLLTVLFFAWIVSYGIKAQFGEHRTGLESLIGKEAEALERVDQNGGRVSVAGEAWNATSNEPIETGESCYIVEFQGLHIIVKPKNKEKETSNG